MALAAAEVTCDVVQSVLALAMAVVAAWTTIRTNRNGQQIKALRHSHARCRRRTKRLLAKLEALQKEVDAKPLDKRTRRG